MSVNRSSIDLSKPTSTVDEVAMIRAAMAGKVNGNGASHLTAGVTIAGPTPTEVLMAAGRGWPIFPLARNAKVPMKGSRSFNDATTDRAQIEAWAQKHPDCNWGLPTGQRSGVGVLDVDPRHDGDETLLKLQQRFGKLPRTPLVRTQSGGLHFYFALSSLTKSTKDRWGSGVEFKADNSYVVLPGSKTRVGLYAWLVSPNDCPLAPAPDWIIEPLPSGDVRSSDFGEVIQNVEREYVTENTESAEQSESHSLSSLSHSDSPPAINRLSVLSVLSVTTPEDAIVATLPTRPGERNDCLMKLARAIRFNLRMSKEDAHSLLRKWHERALDVITTKSFDETRSDFLYAYDRAKYPLGTNLMDKALMLAASKKLPAVASDYDSEPLRKLIGMCWELSCMSGKDRFFLSTHAAAKRLSTTSMQVWRMLNLLVDDGVLAVVERGNERRATRYRWRGGMKS